MKIIIHIYKLSTTFQTTLPFALKVLYLLTLYFLEKQKKAEKSNKILDLLYQLLYLSTPLHQFETLVKSILSLFCITLQI